MMFAPLSAFAFQPSLSAVPLRRCLHSPSTSPLSVRPFTPPPHLRCRACTPTMSLLPPLSLSLSLSLPVTDIGDLTLTGGIFIAVTTWLLLWQQMTSRGIVSSLVTRKVIHISCGPAFVFLWPFYSDIPSARYIASSIPLSFALVLLTTGLSSSSRAALGRALSRRGQARDALQGPLYYTLVLLTLTLVMFKHPAAAVAVMQLCVGDGMAEVIGRSMGHLYPWPVGDKSIPGSLAFVLCAFVTSLASLAWFHVHALLNVSQSEWTYVSLCIALISVTCAAVELAPAKVIGDDNVAIAAVAAALSSLCLAGL